MRVEAHLKHSQAGFGEAGLSCQRAWFTFLRATRPGDCLARTDDGDVEEQVESGARHGWAAGRTMHGPVSVEQSQQRRRRFIRWAAIRCARQIVDCPMIRQDKEGTRCEMRCQAQRQMSSL